MNLIHKTVLLDQKNWELLRKQNINLSAEIRDYLAQRVAAITGSVEGIDLEILKKKLEIKQDKFIKLRAEIRTMEGTIKKTHDLIDQKQIKELENARKKAEEMTKCTKCSKIIVGKQYNLGKDRLCKGCFMSK